MHKGDFQVACKASSKQAYAIKSTRYGFFRQGGNVDDGHALVVAMPGEKAIVSCIYSGNHELGKRRSKCIPVLGVFHAMNLLP